MPSHLGPLTAAHIVLPNSGKPNEAVSEVMWGEKPRASRNEQTTPKPKVRTVWPQSQTQEVLVSAKTLVWEDMRKCQE